MVISEPPSLTSSGKADSTPAVAPAATLIASIAFLGSSDLHSRHESGDGSLARKRDVSRFDFVTHDGNEKPTVEFKKRPRGSFFELARTHQRPSYLYVLLLLLL